MRRSKWNQGWRFWNARDPECVTNVQLPHDAMLTEKRLRGIANGVATGFYPGGKYFYQKSFMGSDMYAAPVVMLEFGGVYMNSTVLLNGEKIGGRIYGYSRFLVDLTGRIRMGEMNELTVIADNTHTPNSRWYSGSGIYRDVYLLTAGQTHFEPDGMEIRTTEIQPVKAEIVIHAEELQPQDQVRILLNDREVSFITDRFDDPADRKSNDVRSLIRAELILPGAEVWSAENPKLYMVRAEIIREGKVLDAIEQRTGFRKLEWNAARGLVVNGASIKLRGGCVHHDHGALGAVSLYAAELRRARKIKEMGFNAIRYAHNPAGEVFLEVCDEVGLYVMDETFDQWKQKQSPYDYGVYFDTEWERDLTDMVSVARNHPSVVMYAIGNEISDVGLKSGAEINRMLTEKCRILDPTRPVTNCINPIVAAMGALSTAETSLDDVTDPYEEKNNSELAGSLLANMIVTVVPMIEKVMGKPDKVEKKLRPVFEELDIVGYNYSEQCYEPHHRENKERIMVGSETYISKVAKNWEYMQTNPHVVGDFVWTVWDYLGESGIGEPVYGKSKGGFNRPYPSISAGCGLFDKTGYAETTAYYAAILWGAYCKPYIGVRPVAHTKKKYFFGNWRMTDTVHSWSWRGLEGKPAAIEVFSPGREVELFLNGASIGRKKVQNYIAKFSATYQPGTLKAVAYDADGKEIGSDELCSAGSETILTVLPEAKKMQADGEDLIYIPIHITDKNGEIKVMDNRKVSVQVNGAAELAGICSSATSTTDDFRDHCYHAKDGRVLAILRSNGLVGDISVEIKAEQLSPVHITLQAEHRLVSLT